MAEEQVPSTGDDAWMGLPCRREGSKIIVLAFPEASEDEEESIEEND
jgi:hypothetical protein